MKGTAYILSTLLLAGSPLAAQETGKISTSQLIEQLGDADYATRKAAERRLLERGGAALDALQKSAKKHDDPEVQWRAGRLARRIQEGAKSGDSSRRTLGKRNGERREKSEKIEKSEREPAQKDRRRVMEDVLKNLDKTFEGREFGADVQREIDRAMEQMRKSLRGMDRGFGDFDDFGRGEAMRRSNSQSMKMTQGPDGVRVEITEKGADGKPKTKVYEAEDMESFKKKHPGVLKDRGIKIDMGEMFGDEFPFRGRILRPRVVREGDRFRIELDGKRTREDRKEEGGRKALRKKGERRDDATDVVEDERKRLGFYPGEISPAVRDYLGLKGGLMVASVVEGSLAAKLGLRKGDIVVRVGKKKIYEVDDVADALEAIGDGAVVVKAIRRGKEITLE